MEYVSGIRQYSAPPPPLEDGGLADPPRAVRRHWPDHLRGDDQSAARSLYLREDNGLPAVG